MKSVGLHLFQQVTTLLFFQYPRAGSHLLAEFFWRRAFILETALGKKNKSGYSEIQIRPLGVETGLRLREKCMHLEEIHGFASPREYQRFVDFIDQHLKAGSIQEITADKNYQRGQVYGGHWFKLLNTGEVWRLVEPDLPFRGIWERVAVQQ